MLTIDGRPLMATEMEVLIALRDELHKRGIIKLEKIKQGEMNIQFNCPIHAGGRERRPSCGLATSSNPTTKAGTVHCFTCGYTASIDEMISHCLGQDDMGATGRDWLIQNFLSVSVQQRPTIALDVMRRPVTTAPSYVTDDELDSYRYIHPYMYKRKLTDAIIEQFDVGYDANFKLNGQCIPSITFPVRDQSGGTLFIARRAIAQKLFHYPAGVDKPVYGIYELPKDTAEVIVCESIINALTCWTYGRPAVALLGLGTKEQVRTLATLNARKLILGLDGDEAGQNAAERIRRFLIKSKIITQFVLPQGKDINDLTEKEFKELQEIF